MLRSLLILWSKARSNVIVKGGARVANLLARAACICPLLRNGVGIDKILLAMLAHEMNDSIGLCLCLKITAGAG
jgi:hypothetical protein